MILSENLTKFSQQNNIIAGITPVREYSELQAALSRPVPFVKYSVEERIDPRLTLENARSVICIGCPYPAEITVDKGLSIAAGAFDYHPFVMDMLEKLRAFLGIGGAAFSDTGPLVDRYIAYLCGLGYYGRNGFIINKKFGTMFFIGYLITPEEADRYDTPIDDACGDCRRCLDACPYGAINGGEMAYERCISCLTQTKGKLTAEQMQMLNSRVYGCDICQLVCPHNRDKVKISHRETDFSHFLTLTNRQFKEKYGNTGIAWRGRATIVRNAMIAHANNGGDISLIEKFLTDENEVLRFTAEQLMQRNRA